MLGLLVVAALLFSGYTLLSVYDGIPTTNYVKAFVSVPTTGNLLSHDAVRIGGKRVGQVLRLDIGKDGRPQVELQLEPGTTLPQDTTIAIRASGLLGSRFVELSPGTSRTMLADGATIRGDESSYTYGLPEAVAVFDEEARGGLTKTIKGLSEGLAANGAPLNQALKGLRTPAGDFQDVARSILAREGAAARLLPSLHSAVVPLNRVRDKGGPFMQAANDTLVPVVAEGGALRDTLSAAPATLTAAENGLRRGRRLLTSVRSLALQADRTLPTAPAGLVQLAGLLREGQAPLRRAEPTVRDLLPATATAARAALVATEPVIGRLKSGIDTARPILRVVGRYACDVINTGAVLRSMTGFAQSGQGIQGNAMAFRLQAVPAGIQAAGITDNSKIGARKAYSEPCEYLSKPYPQLVPGSAIRRSGR